MPTQGITKEMIAEMAAAFNGGRQETPEEKAEFERQWALLMEELGKTEEAGRQPELSTEAPPSAAPSPREALGA
jgi:hypothetical protein